MCEQSVTGKNDDQPELAKCGVGVAKERNDFVLQLGIEFIPRRRDVGERFLCPHVGARRVQGRVAQRNGREGHAERQTLFPLK